MYRYIISIFITKSFGYLSPVIMQKNMLGQLCESGFYYFHERWFKPECLELIYFTRSYSRLSHRVQGQLRQTEKLHVMPVKAWSIP